MDCSMPGFPVHHELLELAQTHGHRVGDAIQPSHPLLSPSLAFTLPSIRVFPSDSVICIRWPSIGVSVSASVLDIYNFLDEIFSLSHSVAFYYFFALITEEGFLISLFSSLELCIQMSIYLFFSLLLASLSLSFFFFF